MKPAERVAAMLAGESVDRAPFCLYPEAPSSLLDGETLSRLVETFVDATNTDLVAVPYGYDYTLEENVSLDRPSNLAGIVPVHARHGNWSHQLDAIRRVCRTFFGKRPVVGMVPSAWTQLQRLTPSAVLEEARSTGFFQDALESLNRSLIALMRGMLEIGVSGIVVFDSGATHEGWTPADYKKRLLPLLNAQLEATGSSAWSAVQFTGRRLFWETLTGELSCRGLGWPIPAGPGLGRGAARWKGFVWGGLDEESWTDQSMAFLRGSLRGQMKDIPGTPLILAAAGPVPNRLRAEQLDALAHSLRSLPAPERLRETPEQLKARRAAMPPRPRKVKEPFERPEIIVRPAPLPVPGAKTRLHGTARPIESFAKPAPAGGPEQILPAAVPDVSMDESGSLVVRSGTDAEGFPASRNDDSAEDAGAFESFDSSDFESAAEVAEDAQRFASESDLPASSPAAEVAVPSGSGSETAADVAAEASRFAAGAPVSDTAADEAASSVSEEVGSQADGTELDVDELPATESASAVSEEVGSQADGTELDADEVLAAEPASAVSEEVGSQADGTELDADEVPAGESDSAVSEEIESRADGMELDTEEVPASASAPAVSEVTGSQADGTELDVDEVPAAESASAVSEETGSQADGTELNASDVPAAATTSFGRPVAERSFLEDALETVQDFIDLGKTDRARARLERLLQAHPDDQRVLAMKSQVEASALLEGEGD